LKPVGSLNSSTAISLSSLPPRLLERLPYAMMHRKSRLEGAVYLSKAACTTRLRLEMSDVPVFAVVQEMVTV
jgi:hypothetical protein